MIIGIDFDNTIVNYDGVFAEAAAEKNVLPENSLKTKESVKRMLLSQGRETDWTKLQGYVYGTKMDDAGIYRGVEDFICQCAEIGWEVVIISHKTKHPVIGPHHYDLHSAALRWIKSTGLKLSDVFFETTRENKYSRIALTRCDIFVDDLPGFLLDSSFPKEVKRILFDPDNQHEDSNELMRFNSWEMIQAHFLENMAVSA